MHVLALEACRHLPASAARGSLTAARTALPEPEIVEVELLAGGGKARRAMPLSTAPAMRLSPRMAAAPGPVGAAEDLRARPRRRREQRPSRPKKLEREVRTLAPEQVASAKVSTAVPAAAAVTGSEGAAIALDEAQQGPRQERGEAPGAGTARLASADTGMGAGVRGQSAVPPSPAEADFTGTERGGGGAGAGRPGPSDALLRAIGQRLADAATPCYPRSAQKRGHEGVAQVRFCIDQRGAPKQIALVRSSGWAQLDAAARCTVDRAAPFPPLPDQCLTVPIRFALRRR